MRFQRLIPVWFGLPILLFGLSLVYLRPLLIEVFSRSYELDELATVWVTNNRFDPQYGGSVRYFGHSPFYVDLLGAVTPFIPLAGEAQYRLMSLLMAILSVFGIVYLAGKKCGPWGALIAGVVFALSPQFVFQSSNVRPYTVALFCCIAGVIFLVRAGSSSNPLWWYAVGLALTIMTLSHYLFALSSAFFIGIAISSLPGMNRRSRVHCLIAGVLSLFGVLTLQMPHLISISVFAKERDWAPLPHFEDLLNALGADGFAGWIWILFLLAFFAARGVSSSSNRASLGYRCWLLVWLIASPLILYLGAVLGNINIFLDRYLLHTIVPFSLLASEATSVLIRSKRPILQASAGILLCLFVISQSSGLRGRLLPMIHSDWRAAVEFARAVEGRADSGTLLFLVSGHAESNHLRWLLDPIRSELLSSPARVYGYQGKIVNLPISVQGADERLAVVGAAFTPESLQSYDIVMILGCCRECADSWLRWADQRLGNQGFVLVDSKNFDSIAVRVLERVGGISEQGAWPLQQGYSDLGRGAG